uniref:Prospero homeobox 2 n=1 Tax=Maylandia zebra TaxID=106582 RepID=A0A3P9D1I5_9CICH
MNLSLPDQSMHSSSEGCIEDDKADVMLPCFHRNMYDEPLASYSNGSIISQLLRKTIHSKRALDESPFYLSSSAVADCSQEDQSSVSSKDSTVEAASPSGHAPTGASPEGEHAMSDHLQAKRARVENIIRVMVGSPNSRQHGDSERSENEARDTREAREAYRENKRKQRLPQHQEHSASAQVSRKPGSSSSDNCNTKDEECHKLKEQLHSMQRLLRHLQEKFLQVYHQEEAEYDRDETEVGVERDILEESTESHYISAEDDFERKNNRVAAECKDRIKVADYLVQARPVPKQRICSSPEMQISTGAERKSQQASSALDHSQAEGVGIKSRSLEYYESSEAHSPQDQTEALSLVVRNEETLPCAPGTLSIQLQYPSARQPHPRASSQIWATFQLRGSPLPAPVYGQNLPRLSRPALGDHCYEIQGHIQPPRPSRSSLLSWGVTVDNLCLPHVKIECGELQGMADRNPYIWVFFLNINVNIQEGLTPSHLKKAKLMFFYTRYPSSNVLKTFFPDVKFNRCITSQLIKWFSNFREFYYIQMEKFARQAIVDGVTDIKDMSVSRDSELFRALNMHYNKANDFHVPDRFLEVAEITLHEFYNAISATKDSDPSWKKAIYKVICKLDSDVPEEFKTSSYL